MSSQTEKTEPTEKPVDPNGPVPHHISDVDTWGGHPDRSYFTFVIISILLGFFGLDHFYLRSFGTGTQKLFVNILSLGFWYWWDVIQIASEGEKIRTKGLNSPLDWVRGIGRGTFVPPVVKEEKQEKKEEPKPDQAGGKNGEKNDEDLGYAAKKSYLIYSFLAIFFGWLGADKFYMGELWQGLAKLISCFNIFLILFGWLWVFWDSFHAFFLTDSILKSGIGVPLPYTLFFSGTIPGELFKVKKVTKEDLEKEKALRAASFGSVGSPGFFGLFGLGSFGEFCSKWFNIPIPTFPVREIYREIVAPLMTVPVVAALKATGKPEPAQPSCVEEALNMIPTTQEVHQAVIGAADTGRMAITTAVEPVSIVSKGFGNAFNKTEDRQALPDPLPLPPPQVQFHQSGGARQESSGPGPVIAGALTAVVLAGGLKGFYDVISKQYG